MARKLTLAPDHVITAQSMASSITSSPLNISQEDSVAIQLVWTGSPVGTFQVQGSLDYVPAISTSNSPPNAGTWTSVTLSPVPTAAGSGDNALIDMYALSFPYIRIVYTRTSGTGTLDAYVSCKTLGA